MNTESFKQGMVAGAKPFGDKLNQLADASERATNDIREGLDSVAGIVDAVLDNLSVQERKRIYDLDQATDVTALDDDEKEFLAAVLAELANMIPNVTDDQKKYLRSICSIANVATPQTSLNLACIENIENMKTQKILLRHVMEFMFIGEQGYGFLNTYEDTVFCYFSVNKRGIAEIQDGITRIYNAMGADGIATRYMFAAEYEELCEDAVITDQELDAGTDESPDDSSIEVESLTINHMVQIAAAQTLTYRFKEIHMGSLINCCGILEFDHCIVYYNESDSSDEISIGVNAEIHATNCTFICKNVDTNPFITLENNAVATFDRCVFMECSYLLASTDTATGVFLEISNCEMHNCSVLVKLGYHAKTFHLSQTRIFDEKLRSAALSSCAALFDVSSNSDDLWVENIMISATIPKSPKFFEIPHGKIAESSFAGVGGTVLSAKSIENCVFERCAGRDSYVVNTALNYEPASVKSCVFDACSEIVAVGDNTVITQCQFVNCSDRLIYSSTSCGIEVSYCEFINYKSPFYDKWQGTEIDDPLSAICLYAKKGGQTSIIKKCIFDGVDINESFLISAKAHGKLSGKIIKVVGCDFRNCSTKRKSGKIIKSYANYLGLFDTVKQELAITIENCRGLDSVKKNGTGVCSNEAVLADVKATKASSGAKSAVFASIGMIGGPAVSLLSYAAYSSAEKKKQKEQDLTRNARAE